MNHVTLRRLLTAAVATITTSVALASPAEAASPDVHVTGVVRVCGNDVTVYEFRLSNLGDQRRGVRGRIVWHGTGYTETFSWAVRRDSRVTQRVRVRPSQRATVTFRAQREVIMRGALVGDCPTKGDVI